MSLNPQFSEVGVPCLYLPRAEVLPAVLADYINSHRSVIVITPNEPQVASGSTTAKGRSAVAAASGARLRSKYREGSALGILRSLSNSPESLL